MSGRMQNFMVHPGTCNVCSPFFASAQLTDVSPMGALHPLVISWRTEADIASADGHGVSPDVERSPRFAQPPPLTRAFSWTFLSPRADPSSPAVALPPGAVRNPGRGSFLRCEGHYMLYSYLQRFTMELTNYFMCYLIPAFRAMAPPADPNAPDAAASASESKRRVASDEPEHFDEDTGFAMVLQRPA